MPCRHPRQRLVWVLLPMLLWPLASHASEGDCSKRYFEQDPLRFVVDRAATRQSSRLLMSYATTCGIGTGHLSHFFRFDYGRNDEVRSDYQLETTQLDLHDGHFTITQYDANGRAFRSRQYVENRDFTYSADGKRVIWQKDGCSFQENHSFGIGFACVKATDSFYINRNGELVTERLYAAECPWSFGKAQPIRQDGWDLFLPTTPSAIRTRLIEKRRLDAQKQAEELSRVHSRQGSPQQSAWTGWGATLPGATLRQFYPIRGAKSEVAIGGQPYISQLQANSFKLMDRDGLAVKDAPVALTAVSLVDVDRLQLVYAQAANSNEPGGLVSLVVDYRDGRSQRVGDANLHQRTMTQSIEVAGREIVSILVYTIRLLPGNAGPQYIVGLQCWLR